MRGLLRHRRYHRHGGGAAADDDNAPAAIVKLFRPELRQHQLALVVLFAREFGPVGFLIAVVAAAGVEEARAHRPAPAACEVLHAHGPACFLAGPGGADDLLPKPDVLHDARLLGGLPYVRADGRAVGDRLGMGPGLEGVAFRS